VRSFPIIAFKVVNVFSRRRARPVVPTFLPRRPSPSAVAYSTREFFMPHPILFRPYLLKAGGIFSTGPHSAGGPFEGRVPLLPTLSLVSAFRPFSPGRRLPAACNDARC